MHEAFFFGPVERQLFACYHPPANAAGDTLTILCPPMFEDYIRTHSMLRKLSGTLASRGQHVLRFDYSGTGDSFGSLEHSSLKQWMKDIQLVVREGFELTGCTKVRVLGVRLAAFLICKSLGEAKELDRLVLWDPVHDGSEYFRFLQQGWRSILENNLLISRKDRLREQSGYPMYGLSENMGQEIMSLSANLYSGILPNKFRVVRTASSDQFPLQDVAEDVVSVDCHWESLDEDVIMSQPILESLAARLIEA